MIKTIFVLISPLVLTFLASLVFWPQITSLLSVVILTASLGLTLFFTIQKYGGSVMQGQISRLTLARHIAMDLLSMFLAIAAASYVGGLAGLRAGEFVEQFHSGWGFAAGLAIGMAAGFLSAWGVRSALGRVMDRRPGFKIRG